jgi:hypothetical protein
MEKAVFQHFYNATVVPLRDKMCEGKEGIKPVDNFEGVYEEYLNQKTLLKILLKREKKDNKEETNNDDKKLDRHKISACITAAIIKTRLISDTNINDKNDDEYLLRGSNRLNEQLAFYCGMSNLIAFMADESDDDIQELKDGVFYFPKTNHSTERIDRNGQDRGIQDYKDSIIRGLYYSNTISGIQTLMLSNIYFLLEAYHKQACELNKLKNKGNYSVVSGR